MYFVLWRHYFIPIKCTLFFFLPKFLLSVNVVHVVLFPIFIKTTQNKVITTFILKRENNNPVNLYIISLTSEPQLKQEVAFQLKQTWWPAAELRDGRANAASVDGEDVTLDLVAQLRLQVAQFLLEDGQRRHDDGFRSQRAAGLHVVVKPGR